METNKNGMPICDQEGCGQLATINLQQNFHIYSITATTHGVPAYKEQKSWEGDTNEFWCEEHAEEEGII